MASELYEKYGDIFYKTGKPKKMYKACYGKEYVRELRKHDKSIGAGMVCAGHSCPYYRSGACGEACCTFKGDNVITYGKGAGRWMKQNIDGDRYMFRTRCSCCGGCGSERYKWCPWCGGLMRAGELWYGEILWRKDGEILWKEGG